MLSRIIKGQIMSNSMIRENLKSIFNAGLNAVRPDEAIKAAVKRQGNILVVNQQTYNLDYYKKIFIVGAGKGAAPMAMAMEEILSDNLYAGLIIVKNGHGLELQTTRVLEAAHPTPDAAGLDASKQMIEFLEETGEEDLVLCLITGGASSLLTLPIDGLSFEEKQNTTNVLLECGATIQEINTIRKHLSKIKAGRLAEIAYPAHVATLIVSDVIGNQFTNIGSGPTAPDHTTFEDCLKIIAKYKLEEKLPESVIKIMNDGVEDRIDETPKEDDQIFDNVNNSIIADNLMAMQAAKAHAEKLGYNSMLLASTMQGEAREVAKALAAIAKEVKQNNNPVQAPACILIGGETTVNIKGDGKGGRNMEFALALALDIANEEGIHALCAGSDGTDGPTDAAGAMVNCDTVDNAERAGLDSTAYLDNNDSYSYFKKLGNLFVTGPTLTNVMDINIILIP